MRKLSWMIALWLCGWCTSIVASEPSKWLSSTAYVIPKETATEGEGYFAIIEGLNRRLYIGTHANGVNSWLVEFDAAALKMNVVVDAHAAITVKCSGFASQSKIHTRNNTGASGKIYFGTKQGYPTSEESRLAYPGGYPMAYDPATGKTQVFPIPIPHQGVISVTPDESRGVAYISTCSDERPIESAHFLVLDLKTGKYRDLMDTQHMYGFIVVDHAGRAYHPILGGDIARFDPTANKLDRLKHTIDGQPPTIDSHLVDPESHAINWDITPDGKTLYALPMSTNQLYRYDLTAGGDTLNGKALGPLIARAKLGTTDCRGMCVGPTGTMWASVTEAVDGIHRHHLVRYRPGDAAPADLGIIAVRNPDFTQFKDTAGKDLPFHGGFYKAPDGTFTTKYVAMGVCEARDGSIYTLVLHPYSLLQLKPSDLPK